MRPISAMGCWTEVNGGLLRAPSGQTVEPHHGDVIGN